MRFEQPFTLLGPQSLSSSKVGCVISNLISPIIKAHLSLYVWMVVAICFVGYYVCGNIKEKYLFLFLSQILGQVLNLSWTLKCKNLDLISDNVHHDQNSSIAILHCLYFLLFLVILSCYLETTSFHLRHGSTPLLEFVRKTAEDSWCGNFGQWEHFQILNLKLLYFNVRDRLENWPNV